MPVIHARCCGRDVHHKTVVACVLITAPDGVVQRRVQTFGTMTADLLALRDWLDGHGVTPIALESTGVYWRPVYNILAGETRAITLVNPQHLQAVPGRKTDVQDSAWLAGSPLGACCATAWSSRVSSRPRRSATCASARASARRWCRGARRRSTGCTNCWRGRTASAARSRPTSSASVGAPCATRSWAGSRSRRRWRAPSGHMARGRLRAKLPELRRALDGRVQPHHRILLAHQLAHIDFLEATIADLQQEITDALRPDDEAVELLQTIPGVGAVAAMAIVAELGVDLGRFPSGRHLASWAGVCPGNKERGGKRLSGKTTKGNVWLRGMLGEVAWSIARAKGTYLHAQYHRIARRRGKYKAIVAVAHSVLVIIYHLLRDQRPYADLGPDYFDRKRQNSAHAAVTGLNFPTWPVNCGPPPIPTPA